MGKKAKKGDEGHEASDATDTKGKKNKKSNGASGSVLGPFTTLVGALLAIAAFVLGSFGDHVVRGWVQGPALQAFDLAAQCHLAHALALVALGVYIELSGRTVLLVLSVMCLILGVCVFSGSLYVSAFLTHAWLPLLTPIGGALLLIGWLTFALHLLKRWRGTVIALMPAPPPG